MSTRTKAALHRLAEQRFPTEEQLGATPPVEQLTWWHDRERHAALAAVVANATATTAVASPTPAVAPPLAFRPPWRTPLGRRTLLAGGLAASAAVAAVAVPHLADSPAYAETPANLRYAPVTETQTPADLLRTLAERAKVQPQPDGTGPYHYIHTQGWDLHTSQDTRGKVRGSGIKATDREQWIADDGSGRLKVSRDGHAVQATGVYRPGELSRGYVTEYTKDSSPEAIRRQLSKYNPRNDTAGWFTVMSDLWKRQVVPPAVQNALLLILAGQPDVTVRGATTDRAGRNGMAVSTERRKWPAARLVLVLDPDTGALLDSEDVALEAGKLPIHAPATVGYTLWLATGYSADTQQHP